MDVQDAASVQSAVDAVLREAGRLDVVVSNAGIMSIGITEGFTEEQAIRQMDVNFMGSFRVARAVLPHLRAQRSGLIIHVTSIVGRLLFLVARCTVRASSRRKHWLKFCNANLPERESRASSWSRARIRPISWLTVPARRIVSESQVTVICRHYAKNSLRISQSCLVRQALLIRKMSQTPFWGWSSYPPVDGRCVRCAVWTLARMLLTSRWRPFKLMYSVRWGCHI